MCFMQDANESADNSARHGQFVEKEKASITELNIFLLEKKFDGK